jgi:hypothetical protein
MSVCRQETYTCSMPVDGKVDLLILQVVAIISGKDLTIFENKDNSKAICLNVSIHNKFCGGNPLTLSAISLVGCVRLLASSELSLTGSYGASVESWMESADQTLMPIVRQQGTV